MYVFGVLLIYGENCTHKPEQGHQQGPEQCWEGGQDAVGQAGHHKTRTNYRRV